ncbi:MAG: hypothetical protein E7172_05155 [Firmicutes bacterium]|nr:hypothetical protein [Bacillota bacterium]
MMELLNYPQIELNLRRTAEKGYISLLHKEQVEKLALKYFGTKDSNGKYIGYMCPYSGKIYSKNSNLILEHIIPVDSKGGTVLFNCIPASKEVNSGSQKGSKHLISWWTNSKFWDNGAPKRLEKLVNYILEAYELVFSEYVIEELEDSYQEMLETEDDLSISKRQNKKHEKETLINTTQSYLGFIIDCIKQLEKENINTININNKLKELENKNIFKDIKRYTVFQNILKQVIIKFTGDDTKSYLTYSIKFDIKKLMDSISYTNVEDIYNEIYSRLQNIQEILSQNNLVIEEYFTSLKDIEDINILYKSIKSITKEEKQKFLSNISLGINTKINEYIELLNQGYNPKYEDKKYKFSNGQPINHFWANHKEQIKERLAMYEKYQVGYEVAKQTIYEIENPIDKISEYIELLNQGYIPKYNDPKTKFNNGELINQFWANHKEQIKERLFADERYREGYETAKNNLKELEFDKIADYIELLNEGYIPKYNDSKTKFNNGELINYFWAKHKEKIKERLTIDERYREGYEVAKQIINELENPIDKICEYIELLNQGYIPKYEDKKNKFSNGQPINYFWTIHKEKIKERLFADERYREGYETAKNNLKELEFDKIADYIELLNEGYIPKYNDPKTKFNNGELINQFWAIHKEKIKERLFADERYREGYEIAKKTLKELEFDKIADYIELLNEGYIPKYNDSETKFSNGESINRFWAKHKEKIKERLTIEERYREGYETAKKIISLDKVADYIELLNKGYIPKSNDSETKFSNGELINQFWSNQKEKIINNLFKIKKYEIVYDTARERILNYFKVNTIEEYYELEQKKKQLKELKNMKQNLENVDNSLEINETISRKRA